MRTPLLTLLCLSLLAPCTASAACDPNIPADLSGDCHVDFNDGTTFEAKDTIRVIKNARRKNPPRAAILRQRG
ncbi:MAG: hypothetical protein ACYSSO_14375 [Planctomycetota bacterium]